MTSLNRGPLSVSHLFALWAAVKGAYDISLKLSSLFFLRIPLPTILHRSRVVCTHLFPIPGGGGAGGARWGMQCRVVCVGGGGGGRLKVVVAVIVVCVRAQSTNSTRAPVSFVASDPLGLRWHSPGTNALGCGVGVVGRRTVWMAGIRITLMQLL